MNTSLTIFKNRFDNKTHRQMSFPDWESFVSLLKILSTKPETKKTAPLISPSRYVEGTTRANRNVECWSGWAAVDCDDLETSDFRSDLDRLCGRYEFVCYSTASSSEVQPKFRLVLPLNREVKSDEIRHFWYALNMEIGELGDPQTKDLSRMYFVPAIYDGAYNFFFTNTGTVVDVDELKSRWEFKERGGVSFLERMPLEMQKAIIEHRKSQLTNTTVVWTGTRDCPFWPKSLAGEYQTISKTGWYHKMYQIMVATAGNAIKRGYPITAREIAQLCKELDNTTGNWYTDRPLEVEADRAVEYAYRNN